MDFYEHGANVYTPQNIEIEYDFSVNTNPLGMPQSCRTALIENIDLFEQYPDPDSLELTNTLSSLYGVDSSWICCTAGASDAIMRIANVLKPKKALLCAPTFSEYERALRQVDCDIAFFDLDESKQFSLGREYISSLNSDLDIAFLCTPNNPTGRVIDFDTLVSILDKALELGICIVLDECFLPFTQDPSCVRILNNYDNLIIVRAFTKIYALAGLRLGVVLSSNNTWMDQLSNAGASWAVSLPAQKAGVAALQNKDWVASTREYVAKERRFLVAGLQNLYFRVIPGEANYLLVQSPIDIYQPLHDRKILIRRCENYRGLDSSWFRIAVRTHDENAYLLSCLEEITR